MRPRWFLLLTVVPLLMAGSCPHDRYVIRMRSVEDGLVERRLDWSREGEDEPVSGERVAPRLRAAYGTEPVVRPDGASIQARFASELPGDIWNSERINRGLVMRHAAPGGTTLHYMERMRGVDDPGAQWKKFTAALDLAVRILKAGVAAHPELADEPAARDRLIRWIETEFTDDLLSATLLLRDGFGHLIALAHAGFENDGVLAEHSISPGGRIADHELARAMLWLLDRGYLRPEEAARLNLNQDQFWETLLCGAVRKAAVALGHSADGPYPPWLDRLRHNPGALDDEILLPGRTALGLSEEALVAAFNVVQPDFSFGPQVRIEWELAVEPLAHNGRWEPGDTAGTLVWESSPTKPEALPPRVLYAFWVQPDEAWQSAHLGRTVLTGQPLHTYLAWHAGLTAEKRGEWDRFAGTLRPGPELIGQLTTFRFHPAPESEGNEHPTTAPVAQDEPLPGATLLLDALRTALQEPGAPDAEHSGTTPTLRSQGG
ncbi:MAG: hypothetical protein IPM18_10360 [Phycisphaerales bacterium]|nr:hypothetical protein [Phycisphaerales bacterium]